MPRARRCHKPRGCSAAGRWRLPHLRELRRLVSRSATLRCWVAPNPAPQRRTSETTPATLVAAPAQLLLPPPRSRHRVRAHRADGGADLVAVDRIQLGVALAWAPGHSSAGF